jgi:hypothetical protein
MSPIFFVIVMEVLSKMILALVNGGLLSGFMGSRSSGTINIFHLLFVDDTLIFCETNPNHLRNLCSLFLCFEEVSGLRINLVKSKLVPFDNVMNIEGLASILGCKVSSLPMKYQGLPLRSLFIAKYI